MSDLNIHVHNRIASVAERYGRNAARHRVGTGRRHKGRRFERLVESYARFERTRLYQQWEAERFRDDFLSDFGTTEAEQVLAMVRKQADAILRLKAQLGA